MAVAEVLDLQTPQVAEAILANRDAAALRTAAFASGMTGLFPGAAALVSEGATSVEEVLRVFGIAPSRCI
jgi:type II secretory ATPase GspE/PulE/Tfp pilus assembly ATPase PilB-like protein